MTLNQKTEKLVQTFDSLEARWQDEKQYEDFNDYRTAMKNAALQVGGKLVSMTNSPFKAVVQIGSNKLTFSISKGQINVVTE